MAGTKNGGLRAAQTNKQKYGADFYAKIGGIGGSKKVKKGFALNPKLAAEAGARGGAKSRRGPAKSKVAA